MADRLPKFSNPPVVEVALSIVFEALDNLTAGVVGRLWRELEPAGFTRTEDKPELPPVIEDRTGPPPPPRLELLERPRLRVWFQTEDETQLLQVQRDRIAYNWKKASSEPYPSYEVVENRFRELLPIFVDFIKRQGMGDLTPTHAEVTYVNHIHEAHANVADVFKFWSNRDIGFPPHVEDVTLRVRYPILDGHNHLGMLSLELQPAYLVVDSTEILNLNVIARGRPLTNDIDGALRFLNLGHEWIVQAFTNTTTSVMHRKWGRTQ